MRSADRAHPSLPTRALWTTAALLAFSAAEARADGAPARYTSVFEEEVEGLRADHSVVEAALIRMMIQEGATFMDEAQSRKIRALTSASALLSGPLPEVITTFEADVLIAGVVRVSRAQVSALLRDKAERYEASVSARLIAVDTGQVLDSILLNESGFGTSRAAASESALRRAGEALGRRVLAQRTSRKNLRRLELTIADLPDVAATERVRAGLLTIPGVKSIEVAHASERATELELVLDDGPESTRELAQSLQQVPELGLVVTGYSPRAIAARYSNLRAPRLPLVVGRLGGPASDDASRLAEVVARVLVDRGGLEAVSSTPEALGDAPKAHERALRSLGRYGKDGLFLTGRQTRRGSAIDLELELRSTREGLGLVLADATTCTAETLLGCTRDLATRLAERLPKTLAERQLLGGPSADLRPITLGDLEASDLFPARSSAYQSRGFGRLRLQNQGSAPATHGRLKVQLAGLLRSELERELPDLMPGAEQAVPIPLTFEETALAGIESDRRLPLEVTVTYEIKGRRVTETRTRAVQVLDKNAVDWSTPSSISAFVTPKSAPIRAATEAALAALPEALSAEPLARPAALFRVLGGLRYQRDAVHPGRSQELDHVQFPVETLSRGRGDCDDLSVLFASLAEAAGLRTMLVLTPGHVLVALDSELPTQSPRKLALDPKRTLQHGGRAWIPVEATLVGRPFFEAWAEGARVVERTEKQGAPITWIDVREAWGEYAPETFAQGGPAKTPVSFEGLAGEIQSIVERRARELQLALAESDTQLATRRRDRAFLNERALLLVALGRAQDARAVLEEALSLGQHDELLNNLGNVWLLLGDAGRAGRTYVEALARPNIAPAQQLRIHLNAAVAARLRRAHGAFADHIADALELARDGATRGLIRDFLGSLGGESAVAGAPSGAFDARGLAQELGRALETRGLSGTTPAERAQAPRRAGVRADDRATATRIDVGDFVFWFADPARRSS